MIFFVALLLAPPASPAAAATPYLPAPAADVPGYSATVLPCRVEREWRPGGYQNASATPAAEKLAAKLGYGEAYEKALIAAVPQFSYQVVICTDEVLEKKSLRELSILRNTIYARWGWSGYRKEWLKEYFAAQPWFKPNPKFKYSLVSDVDVQNARFIAIREQSFTYAELSARRDDIYARRGRVWNDVPSWDMEEGKPVVACEAPEKFEGEGPSSSYATGDGSQNFYGSRDCRYKAVAWYKADPTYTDERLSKEDRIELGLLARSLGDFALDEGTPIPVGGEHERAEERFKSLDGLLKVADLRKLSLRDLRLLRNTIYARRGRPFKSTILQEHFGGMPWYKADLAYTDARLTKTDGRNITMIKSVEQEFGGPLDDSDWRSGPVDPDWQEYIA